MLMNCQNESNTTSRAWCFYIYPYVTLKETKENVHLSFSNSSLIVRNFSDFFYLLLSIFSPESAKKLNGNIQALIRYVYS